MIIRMQITMHAIFKDTIFVFGSNTEGRHGAGAAKFAAQWMGAICRQAEGLQGQSYAIPTKDLRSCEPLPLDEIARSLQRFGECAEKHADRTFMLTRIGCGLAGHPEQAICEMAQHLPSNVLLPGRWRKNTTPALIIAGSRGFQDFGMLKEKVDKITATLPSYTVISGGARGADQLGERYANERQITIERYAADWSRYGKLAGPIRKEWPTYIAKRSCK